MLASGTDSWMHMGEHELSRLRSAARGARAGLAATGAMTAMMAVARPRTRGDLGPRQVTGWLLGRVDRLRAGERAPLLPSMVNHAAYGSLLGALYGLVTPPNRSGYSRGLLYGLGVWVANYAGMLPSMDVLPAPHRDDPSHAVRLHVAHWVYGATLGAVHGRGA